MRQQNSQDWSRLMCGLIVAGGLAGAAHADVVLGRVLPLRQPDGTTVDVRIWGDEFYTVVEALDGYTLVRDPASGVICYAALSDDGDQLVSTGVAVGQGSSPPLDVTPHIRINPKSAAEQARAAREGFERRQQEGPFAVPRDKFKRGPTSGDVLGLCVIIDFSDDVGTIPPYEVTNYCNQPGYTGYGNNGSVHDYFFEVSERRLNYTNYVPAAYYRALHPKTYYTDPNIPYAQRAQELLLEALYYLEAHGLDFSQFDSDSDGVIDALNCYYAGYSNSAWATGLWPHASGIYFEADGVYAAGYQMSDMQNALHLSTFCHENGHMLMGWPDLYDYDYDSTGVGQFCLMCYGTTATNPCQPCAYMKHIAGWAVTNTLVVPQIGLTAPSDLNIIYKFPHPTRRNEYYLIENRQRIGRDAELPAAGLAIWHIDTRGSNNNQQQTPESHYLVTLVQADGRWDLEHNRNYGDADDLFSWPLHRQCTPATNPNTNWWDGTQSGLSITGISGPTIRMTFNFSQPSQDCNGNGVSDWDDIASGVSQDCNGNWIPDECDLAAGASQDCNGNGVPDECEPDCNANGLPDDCELAVASGLAGAYYDNRDLTGPRYSRIDPTVNFDWSTGSPWPGLEGDTFSVRWTGYIKTLSAAGAYRFFTRTDDGVRLWVNGQLLVDHWQDQGPTEWSGMAFLQRDAVYRLVMEYYENGGDALAQLRWQPPGQAKTVIPAANLLPARDCDDNGVLDECDIASGTMLDANSNGLPDNCEYGTGDLNCDGAIDFADINPFVLALTGRTEYLASHPDCNWLNADCGHDGRVDFADINPFVALLGG